MNGWICLIWVVVVLLFPGGVMYEIVMWGGGGREAIYGLDTSHIFEVPVRRAGG